MTTRPEIYLDMDGVCVDFIGAAMQAQGYDANALLRRWRLDYPGSLYPEPLFDVTAEDFFTHKHLTRPEFWRDLRPYPWFDSMYQALEHLGHVVFLTAPTSAPGSVSGKLEWLTNTFGHGFKDYIFTRHKDRLAHRNAYLIDDMPFNITSFERRQGTGVLFPQAWNELAHIEDPGEHTLAQLRRIMQDRP